MKLSFIIIAYNEEKNIPQVLDSIFAQQDLPNKYEVIVVNDGSTDRTIAEVKRYQKNHKNLSFIDLKQNQGRGVARASGVSKAKGDYLAFVDADIILPTFWLERCMKYMDKFDACSGTAVPDGDVTWLYNKLKLKPKVVPHRATITGSNGLFNKKVFDVISFNKNKKNGEDVDLDYKMKKLNIKTTRVNGLLVRHNESKDFIQSLNWLFVSGIGAAKQMIEQKKIRIPDLTFLGTLFIAFTILISEIFVKAHILVLVIGIIVSILYLLCASLAHLFQKFYLLSSPVRGMIALLLNSFLLLSYFSGRFIGLFLLKNRTKGIAS